jgi:uncharacterized membrane protein
MTVTVKKSLIFIIVFSLFSLGFLLFAANHTLVQADASTQQTTFYQGKVIKIDSQGVYDINGDNVPYQKLEIQLLEGPDSGKTVSVENDGQPNTTLITTITAGEKVVLTGQNSQYAFVDIYRLDYLPIILVLFIILVLLVIGKKGISSLIGLGIGLTVIILWMLPMILKGQDPLTTCIIGSVVILIASAYLAHGFSKKTSLALVATLLALILTVLVSTLAVNATRLFGFNNEAIYTLQLDSIPLNLNFNGLLLAGIIIGTLGALLDISTNQVNTMFNIFSQDNKIKFATLVKQAREAGKAHIASLMNILVFAYAGCSLIILLVLIMNPQNLPVWLLVNSEDVFDEIIRALAGSACLLLSVPLVTYLTGWYLTRRGLPKLKQTKRKFRIVLKA